METIRLEEADFCANSDNCKLLEYSFKDKDMDLGVATITGRYPEKGYTLNTICKELVYILEGNGVLVFRDRIVEFKKGDAILIDRDEPYYWDSNYAVASLTCSPAFDKEQYKLVD